jgi:ADP-ribose pyrophosphatase YjhB (NUDIX family)
VAALVLLDGSVVTVRHRAGSATYHLLPGGGVGWGETLADALVREVREETGLAVSVAQLLFVNDTIDPSGHRHVVNLTFRANAIGGQITEKPEDARVEAVDLVAVEELEKLDFRPPMARELRRAIEGGAPQTEYLGSLFTAGA